MKITQKRLVQEVGRDPSAVSVPLGSLDAYYVHTNTVILWMKWLCSEVLKDLDITLHE